MDKLFSFIDRHAIVATTVLYVILYLTVKVFFIVVEYGIEGEASVDKAGVIAAILTPISGLMAGAVKFYNDRKLQEREDNA